MIATEPIVSMFEHEAEGEAKEMYTFSSRPNYHRYTFKHGYMIGCFEETMRLIQEKNPELYEEIKQLAKSRQPK